MVKELLSLDAYRMNPHCSLHNFGKQKLEMIQEALTSSGGHEHFGSHESKFVLPYEDASLSSSEEDIPQTLELPHGKGHLHQ